MTFVLEQILDKIGGAPPSVTPVDKSGTITAGGVAQNIAAANAVRIGFWIQNQSTGSLWLSDIGTATQASPSIEIKPGQLYESPYGGTSNKALSLIGATTGQAFAAREW